MDQCPGVSTCPFYMDRMAAMPTMAGMMKRHFCLDDYSHCARLMVKEKLGKERVPADLYPNQSVRAKQLLGAP